MVTAADSELLDVAFERDGYVVARGLIEPDVQARQLAWIERALTPLQGPAEFEADVGYPGAPLNRDAPGGQTPRRLLQAFSRDEAVAELALHGGVESVLNRLMRGRQVLLSQCHHNCVMTKYPGYSSATLWHQDIRYWSFDRAELISVWFALGSENAHNGALRVIPGSHRLDLDRGRLDADLFLRPDLPDNRALIEQNTPVTLEAGDVLFFHCRLFHAAGMNRSDQVKLSPVFTYHAADNRPIPGTRSDRYPSIPFEHGQS